MQSSCTGAGTGELFLWHVYMVSSTVCFGWMVSGLEMLRLSLESCIVLQAISNWSGYCNRTLHSKAEGAQCECTVKYGRKLQIPSWRNNSFFFFLLTICSVLSVIQAAGCSALFPRDLLEVLECCQQGGSAFWNNLFFWNPALLGHMNTQAHSKQKHTASKRAGGRWQLRSYCSLKSHFSLHCGISVSCDDKLPSLCLDENV